jgi:hypothetical protein
VSAVEQRARPLLPRTPDPASLADVRAFQQRRVRLYLGFLLVLFGLSFALDSGTLFVTEGARSLLAPGHLAVFALVVTLLSAWLLTRARELGVASLGVLEAGMTLAIAGVGLVVLQGISPDQVAAGPMLAMALMLVARSAIVPSSGLLTLAVGSAVTAITLVGYHQRAADVGNFAGFTLLWLSAFTLASSFVSRVIYGLQEQVRKAGQLGQYVLEERLGEGGMGVVYRASHQLLRRPTAVKLMARADRERDIVRFEHEVRQTARLRHPNTVTVYDYGRTVDGVFYYAMELLHGATLETVVAMGGPLPPARVRRILSAVAGALAEAHAVQLIHRDIKPANIMLCEQGGEVDVVKVLDFGLVKDLSATADVTHSETLTGTPAFMSPESIQEPARIGPASDIYALGAVGYFLLTGKQVFDGTSVLEICSHHLLTAPVPPSRRAAQAIPVSFERLILDCLEKPPERRPATAADLRTRLAVMSDAGDWSDASARAWWAEHRGTLQSASKPPKKSPLERTLAVDWQLRS